MGSRQTIPLSKQTSSRAIIQCSTNPDYSSTRDEGVEPPRRQRRNSEANNKSARFSDHRSLRPYPTKPLIQNRGHVVALPLQLQLLLFFPTSNGSRSVFDALAFHVPHLQPRRRPRFGTYSHCGNFNGFQKIDWVSSRMGGNRLALRVEADSILKMQHQQFQSVTLIDSVVLCRHNSCTI
jgi:hypothetical protein